MPELTQIITISVYLIFFQSHRKNILLLVIITIICSQPQHHHSLFSSPCDDMMMMMIHKSANTKGIFFLYSHTWSSSTAFTTLFCLISDCMKSIGGGRSLSASGPRREIGGSSIGCRPKYPTPQKIDSLLCVKIDNINEQKKKTKKRQTIMK